MFGDDRAGRARQQRLGAVHGQEHRFADGRRVTGHGAVVADDMIGGDQGGSPTPFGAQKLEPGPQTVGQPAANLPAAVVRPDLGMKDTEHPEVLGGKFAEHPFEQVVMASEGRAIGPGRGDDHQPPVVGHAETSPVVIAEGKAGDEPIQRDVTRDDSGGDRARAGLGEDVPLAVVDEHDRVGAHSSFPHQLTRVEPDLGTPAGPGVRGPPRPVLAESSAVGDQQHRPRDFVDATLAGGEDEVVFTALGLCPGQDYSPLGRHEVVSGAPRFPLRNGEGRLDTVVGLEEREQIEEPIPGDDVRNHHQHGFDALACRPVLIGVVHRTVDPR
ncbi:hypothetical protein BB31_36440 [Amycolatopsis lurida NRRL 2430]|uniref:Uncharacterized protein n=1 Tax=Amycolatopsis lurida NRRL 2430 TaxID=1460371 RepID=A0A2P2FHZ5_AMYLU|nr:hypothetical protein BB31_36440 [Amycolatopsis lurida NRRL 2430]